MADFKIVDNRELIKQAKVEAIARALESIGMTAEAYAALFCPVDTGRLRASITHVVDDDAVYIGTNVEYAPYVELGTSKQKAQPYLRPAIERHLDAYKAIAETELKRP